MTARTADDMLKDLAKKVLPNGTPAAVDAKAQELKEQFAEALAKEDS